MTKPILLVLAVFLILAIAGIGAEAQLVYPRYPIWVPVVSAQLCLLVFVYRVLKR